MQLINGTRCEEYIQKIERDLPEFCGVKDLIKVGIFKSGTSACEARQSGNSPPYLQISKHGRVMYPKHEVIAWVRGKMNVHL